MKRKIFVSINIREKDKKKLSRLIEKWLVFPVKWIKEDNLHITLLFLGHINDDSLKEICDRVREAAVKSDIFDLEFNQISLGPDKENPRMVWLNGKISEELRILQENTEKKLGIFVASKKSFSPHITLGKIRARKWKNLENKPEIFSKVTMVVSVESIEVMASDFIDDGPEYTVIESCPLS